MNLLSKWPSSSSNRQQTRIVQLESNVNAKITEITDMHVRFSKHVDSVLSNSNCQKPSYTAAAKAGTSSVLVASFADGEKPTEPLNVAAIENLLDVQSSGLIPQGVREKDNSVYITFPDPVDVSKATSVLKKTRRQRSHI